ncbi:AAA family ATPase [Inmirania thermothiophila]|uniref:Aminoglycoside phosphotransferase domain-containing protein n=1 Tax=Inmirania thermothiophila TaxID=1750597 RepID=A0A3N1Y262_9GAMM|nr:bifunctional aminoglycoside phosphotransferase/ATP-binding protein [Inmirania thermothiophila]ROR32611.1 hypothetical protein EDC57_1817 [Inmirania thermothiophila]
MQERPPLVEALLRPQTYGGGVDRVELVETHISWVFLAGDRAYKVKKPVDLGFLDFTTLERRRRFCEEELRLNRRLAPELYLAVIPITGTPQAPRLGGEGTPIEYALVMRRFDQEALLDRLLARGALAPAELEQAAADIARFHARAAVADPASRFGRPETVHAPVRDNFAHMRRLSQAAAVRQRLDRLEAWAEDAYARLAPVMEARRRDGRVRECHGDIHLGNMARVDGRVRVFDAIEFNDDFRWIDTASDLAFPVMDLHDRGRPDLATVFLDAYLEAGGDWEALRLLRYYMAYRANVRAKVTLIRAAQAPAEAAALEERAVAYLDLADALARGRRPALVLCCGPSGAGKSHWARRLAPALGAVRVRSDVERKRLFGLAPTERAAAAPGEGIYTPEASRRTYARLAEIAAMGLEARFPVVVDAAALSRAQRAGLREVAAAAGCPFVILAFHAPPEVLRSRVARRARSGHDASDADLEVLAAQLRTLEPPHADEADRVIDLDGHRAVDVAALAAAVEELTRG